MRNLRIIPRLDIKGPNLVKGINLEGLRIMGDPQLFAEKYYLDGADEIIYIDSVASLYGRNNLKEVVNKAARKISIPLTVGGGLRTIDDIKQILNSGADKVAINTEAVSNPEFIKKCVSYFGSSTIVLSINYKSWPNDNFKSKSNITVGSSQEKDVKKWKNFFQVYTENGRQQTGLDAFEWAQLGEKYGVGENHIDFVFHGGSGSTVEEIREAIGYGVIKMNIDTDLQYAFLEGVRDYIQGKADYLQAQIGNPEGEDQPNKKYYDPRVWLREGEKTFIARLKKAFEDLNNVNTL